MEQINSFQTKFFKFLAYFISIFLIVFLFIYFTDSGSNESEVNTISVTGEAEISVVPDVATINLTVESENIDLNKSLDDNSQRMNNVINFVKSKGVEDKDIKTTYYDIYPRYEYEEDYRNRYLAGYEVTQTINIKIRDLTQVGDIIAGAATYGANNVSSLSFIVDDDASVKEEAQAMAIANAKVNAEKLEKELGVKFSKIVGFSESSNNPAPVYYDYAQNESAGSAKTMSAPSIQTGENTITSTVYITYEIK